MFFGEWSDSHDRRIEKLMARDDITEQEVTNFNLVGIRRRLNNIQVGVWLIVFLLAAIAYRLW